MNKRSLICSTSKLALFQSRRFMLGLHGVWLCKAIRENREYYSTWQWSLVLNGCNTFAYTASGSLLNTRSKQVFALVADWTTCEKPLVIEKLRSSFWIPSTGAVKACQSIPPQLKSPLASDIQWYFTFENKFKHRNKRPMLTDFGAL